mgnify:CR=1 FL=1|tara:strand:+ start:802 stop:1719 length:918 start_codon:yes stop_codon:yes gene_type:complete
MGLLDGTNQATYYNSSNSPNYGNYQFISLDHIINGFMISYVGEGKIIKKVNRTDVQFHAMRAIQELSYDVFRSIKAYEINVPNTLKMILPQDYVNYVKLTRIDSNGIERLLYPTGKTSNPFHIKQSTDGTYGFDDLDNDGTDDTLDTGGGDPYIYTDSSAWENYQDQTADDSYGDDETDRDIDSRGRRYGLDPQHAQANGTFYIDYLRGYIHFGSSLAGQDIILKYISDGLGTDDEMVVHKFCEEACYKWIAHGVLATRSNVPEYLIARFKKERFAESRKAKIRLSNIKIEEFTQVLKGMSKPIK